MAGGAARSRQRALSGCKTRPTCDCDVPLAPVCFCCFCCSCSTAAICCLTRAAACLTASALRMSSLAVASSTCRLQAVHPSITEICMRGKEFRLAGASGQRLWEWLHSTCCLWALQGRLDEHALSWSCRPFRCPRLGCMPADCQGTPLCQQIAQVPACDRQSATSRALTASHTPLMSACHAPLLHGSLTSQPRACAVPAALLSAAAGLRCRHSVHHDATLPAGQLWCPLLSAARRRKESHSWGLRNRHWQSLRRPSSVPAAISWLLSHC